MTRFTDRVERDLSQISDRATPSSTAWEAIRHRIDEQDSQPHRDTTTEVIMLDPDTNRLQKRPRTGLLVAASVAAIALVGGLVVVANRDDDASPADRPEPTPTVVATDPAIAGDPEAAPVVVDPDLPTDPEGEILPPAEQVSAGSAEATCAFGAPAMSADGTGTTLEQTCTFDETAVLPFDATQNVELTVQDARAVAATQAAPYSSVADSGLLSAGYSYAQGGVARFVGVAPGTGDYEGQQVFITGLGEGNVDAVFDWTLDETLPAPPGASESSAEVMVECALTGAGFDEQSAAITYDQACTFSGDDPVFVPEPASGQLQQFDSDPSDGEVVDETGGFTYVTSVLGDDVLFSGLIDRRGVARFVSVWPGTGDLEGMLIHGVARIESTPDPTPDDPNRVTVSGTIQVTALPRPVV